MTTKSMIEDFAENKYFIGVVMITMNIGARFLIDELTPEQKKTINSQNFRRFIVFCAFFAAALRSLREDFFGASVSLPLDSVPTEACPFG